MHCLCIYTPVLCIATWQDHFHTNFCFPAFFHSKKCPINEREEKEREARWLVHYKGDKRFSSDRKQFLERSRDHITSILQTDKPSDFTVSHISNVLQKLSKIYNNAIKPLEEAYKFNDMKRHSVSDGQIFALPTVTFIGPWSTGKSSLINYFTGLENTSYSLDVGPQPTTTDFTVLRYGPDYKQVEGMVLTMDNTYASLEQFGQGFLQRLKGTYIPNKLLQKVTFIDTPGIIENKRQHERGYPFDNVFQWFIDRSDMIVVVFDPSKLDVGAELETLFMQLKGHEAKVKIVLNKADTLTSQELLRLYGALFWSLASLINVTEPPRVYVGSFWSKEFHLSGHFNDHLYEAEEVSLLQDLYDVMANSIENKIAFIRKHAVLVRNHALFVDQFYHSLNKHRSFFQDPTDMANIILKNPDKYRVFQTVLAHSGVSQEDVPPVAAFIEFFSLHPMDSFLPLSSHCYFFSPCLLNVINNAIYAELPALLQEFSILHKALCHKEGYCSAS